MKRCRLKETKKQRKKMKRCRLKETKKERKKENVKDVA